MEPESSDPAVALAATAGNGVEYARARDVGVRAAWERMEHGAIFRLSLPLGTAR